MIFSHIETWYAPNGMERGELVFSNGEKLFIPTVCWEHIVRALELKTIKNIGANLVLIAKWVDEEYQLELSEYGGIPFHMETLKTLVSPEVILEMEKFLLLV